MDFIAEIRRRHFISGEDISSIARSLNLSRTTVRKHLLTTEEPVYHRKIQTFPKLGDFQERLEQCVKQRGKMARESGKTASKTVHPDMCHDPVFCRRNLGCYLWILLLKSEGVIL